MNVYYSILRNYIIIEKNDENVNCICNVMDDYHEFSYLGSFACISSAMNIILKDNVKLVFINIDTFKNPFVFSNELTLYIKKPPVFIAISAYKEKAYEVIKNGFFDILLTPITELETRKFVQRFQKKKSFEKKSLFV